MGSKRAPTTRTQTRTSVATAKRRPQPASWISGWSVLLAVAVIAVLAASFILPGTFDKKTSSAGAARAKALGVALGAGVPVGSTVPAFSGRDLLSGQPITADGVYDHKTLLFFSEGVMCEACFEQIRDLQQVGAERQRRGIQLISITPDPPSELRRTVDRFGITTPVMSDADRTMSEAFNTLGQGMHSNTPGHAFVLIDHGKVVWYRDYWLPPYKAMYVPPAKLLADIPLS